ncbi:hypothetical protein Tco_0760578 [Tanacetum coccineum]
MLMHDMILQRRVGILRKEMKAVLTLSLSRVVRHLAKVVVLPNLGVSGGFYTFEDSTVHLKNPVVVELD